MGKDVSDCNGFKCPECGHEAVIGILKFKAYCAIWNKMVCRNCKITLFPNQSTRRAIWKCFFKGLIIHFLFSKILFSQILGFWDRIFDIIFGIIWAIPYIRNYSIFSVHREKMGDQEN
jgi:hypothetical protein